ncbi:hypothetical protein, partial [Moorena sp. SIO2C4]|uniref:hypothetical protein n=1 Tax=Moorena sp. SIO2C4 TaxID=2607824 RepID=UPI0013CDCFC7
MSLKTIGFLNQSNQQPVSRQPSAVSRQPSAVSRQPSAVSLFYSKAPLHQDSVPVVHKLIADSTSSSVRVALKLTA